MATHRVFSSSQRAKAVAAEYSTTDPAVGFAYDEVTYTATWTLAQPLPKDKLLLHVTNSVTDNDGERLGVYQLCINALPGDADRSGRVNSIDKARVKARENLSTTNPTSTTGATYTPYDDVDASGTITGTPGDGAAVDANINAVLPTGEATAPLVPGTPAGLAVDGGAIRAEVSWIDVAEESHYEVQRSDGASGPWSDVGVSDADDPTFTDSVLQPDTRYFYRVRAAGPAGVAEWSAPAEDTTAPPSPGDLHATGFADRIDLTWRAIPSATSYNLYRTTPGVAFGDTPHQTGLTAASFSDTGLPLHTGYEYAVAAVNGNGESLPSTRVPSATLPAQPTGLSAIAVSGSQIDLSWTGAAGPVTEYVIERRHRFVRDFEQISVVAGGTTTYSDTLLPEGTRIEYRVRARNYGGITPEGWDAYAYATTKFAQAPTNLTVHGYWTEGSKAWLDLSWSYSSESDHVFHFEVKEPGGVWKNAGGAARNSLRGSAHVGFGSIYPDPPTPAPTQLEVRMRAKTPSFDAESPPSESKFATATPVGTDRPTVYWPYGWNGVQVPEQGGTITAPLRRTGDDSSPLTVYLDPPGGTATWGATQSTAGADYTMPMVIHFPAESNEVQVPITPINDQLSEWDEGDVGIRAHPSYRTIWAPGWGSPLDSWLYIGIAEDDIFDVDVDSDNRGGIGEYPQRSLAEEEAENIQGDDTRPGKVVLVGDGDSDADGIPDFADGFDLDPQANYDAASRDLHFTPLVVQGLASPAKLRITYQASDPSAVTATVDDPYVLPAGQIRLWRKDGHLPRNKATVATGGDYIAPGEYLASQLLNGATTLYVEALRPSQATGDIAVTIELDPTGSAGYTHTDTVRLTATKMEILGRGYGETQFERRDWLVASDLSSEPVDGFTPGQFQTHKVRVYDPRNLSGKAVTVDGGQGLPLQYQSAGGYYETPEFVAVRDEDTVVWSVPYPHVSLSDYDVELRYNPPKKLPRMRSLKQWPVHVTDMVTRSRRITQEMKADMSWMTPDKAKDHGAFGTELGKRLAAEMETVSPRWQRDVHVDVNTKQVVFIGDKPPDDIGNNINVQQVDLVYHADGSQRYGVGDTWSLDRLDSVHEIKTSVGDNGKLRGNQKRRYEILTNGGEKLHMTATEEVYNTRSKTWKPNRRWDDLVKVWGPAGAGAVALVGSELYMHLEAFDALTAKYEEVAKKGASILSRQQQGQAVAQHEIDQYWHGVSEWSGLLVEYTARYLEDDVAVSVSRIVAAAVLKNLGQPLPQ